MTSCLAPSRTVDVHRRRGFGPVRAALSRAAGARGRGRSTACAGDRRRCLRRWRQLHGRDRDRRRLAADRTVHRPRHHLRSLSADGATPRARTPSISAARGRDLECLYGAGQLGSPFLCRRDDPAQLLLGRNERGEEADVPRNAEGVSPPPVAAARRDDSGPQPAHRARPGARRCRPRRLRRGAAPDGSGTTNGSS